MNETRVTKRPEIRELIVERVVSAPRVRVWAAWTEPEHIARWWGPFAWTTTVHEMEVRPGGRWRYTLAPDDGMGDTVRGLAVYDQVDAPHTSHLFRSLRRLGVGASGRKCCAHHGWARWQ